MDDESQGDGCEGLGIYRRHGSVRSLFPALSWRTCEVLTVAWDDPFAVAHSLAIAVAQPPVSHLYNELHLSQVIGCVY